MPHSSGLEFSSSKRFRLEGSRVGGRGEGGRGGVEWVVKGQEGEVGGRQTQGGE